MIEKHKDTIISNMIDSNKNWNCYPFGKYQGNIVVSVESHNSFHRFMTKKIFGFVWEKKHGR